MRQWEIVDRNIVDMDSRIKNADRKHKLKEVKETYEALKKKIEEFNYICRDMARKHNAFL